MQSADYPSLYNKCDDCATKKQKTHFQLVETRIILLITIAIIGSIAWRNLPQLGIYVPIATAVGIGILFGITIFQERNSCEKDWFVTRAIAELIKKRTWLYMMRVYPYDSYSGSDNKDTARFERFLDKFAHIEDLPKEKLPIEPKSNKITTKMKNIRNLPSAQQRLKLYIEERIIDQIKWYEKKSKTNTKKQKQLEILMYSLLLIAGIIAILNIFLTDLLINGVGIATTMSACVLSWIGSKKYSELSQAYGNAADKLSAIKKHAATPIDNEQALAKIVKAAESIMSQEHNLWAIKRLPVTNKLLEEKVR